MKLINIFAALSLVAALTACDDKFEQFETVGYTGAPVTVSADAFSYEALPGAIKLKWTVPADSSYSYMKVWYNDPVTGQTQNNVVSVYTDSLLIENTLQKYGDYTFYFQAFNDRNEGGEVVAVKAQSGRRPATVTVEKTKVNITADQLSTDDPEPTEGPVGNLVDGNPSTFFHTRWTSPQVPLPQYFQVDFKESHQNFIFWYQNRNGSQVGPENLEIQVSDDGSTWNTVTTITTGLPSGSGEEYTSDYIQAPEPFTHFRFVVTKTFGDTWYFNLAEFAFYDARQVIYDPESE